MCAGTLYPAGTRRPADRIAATVGRYPAPEPITGAETISGDRNRRSDRRSRRTSARIKRPQDAPQSFTWYQIPHTMPERLQSHGSDRRAQAMNRSRRSCRTAYNCNFIMLQYDSMMIQKDIEIYHDICYNTIKARETRNEKSRTAKPDRTGGAANKSEIP